MRLERLSKTEKIAAKLGRAYAITKHKAKAAAARAAAKAKAKSPAVKAAAKKAFLACARMALNSARKTLNNRPAKRRKISRHKKRR